MPAIKHVLIAGAGLSGPALALCLARQGIRSTIFEIRSSPSTAGGSITLASHAIRALNHPIGVYDKLRDAGYSYSRMGAYSDDGYRFGDILTGDVGEGGYPALRIMRHRLQGILLESCKEASLVDVKWGGTCTGIQESASAVTVSFADGTTIQGDCLIGCDGIHSRVRSHVIPIDTPSASFFGQCTINGFVPSSQVSLPDGYPPAFVLFTSRGILMVVPIDKNGETLAWGITTDTAERDRAGWKEYEESGQAARDGKAMFADVATEPLRSVLDNANEKQAKVWPHHSLPDLPTWHRGRVCLLGDAAHALPPNGQGTALAFEDAAFMSRMLSSDQAVAKGYDKLFGHFESSRRKRVEEIKKSAKPSSTVKSTTGPWAWWIKQWAFWAFFAWHRGQVRFGRDGSYDVMTESIDVE